MHVELPFSTAVTVRLKYMLQKPHSQPLSVLSPWDCHPEQSETSLCLHVIDNTLSCSTGTVHWRN